MKPRSTVPPPRWPIFGPIVSQLVVPERRLVAAWPPVVHGLNPPRLPGPAECSGVPRPLPSGPGFRLPLGHFRNDGF